MTSKCLELDSDELYFLEKILDDQYMAIINKILVLSRFETSECYVLENAISEWRRSLSLVKKFRLKVEACRRREGE